MWGPLGAPRQGCPSPQLVAIDSTNRWQWACLTTKSFQAATPLSLELLPAVRAGGSSVRGQGGLNVACTASACCSRNSNSMSAQQRVMHTVQYVCFSATAATRCSPWRPAVVGDCCCDVRCRKRQQSVAADRCPCGCTTMCAASCSTPPALLLR